jgi:endonuclease/exonuclease/phosphatase (EEP) superfamily protein YafD
VRRFLTLFFGLAMVSLFVITGAGLLAPLFEPFDTINHLRLHFLETAVALVVVFSLLRARRLAMGAFALALVNMVLAAPAFALTATAKRGGQELRLVTLNAWGENAEPRRIEAYLRRQNADIVLILEAGETLAPMLETLRDLYPYRVDCIQDQLCRLALLSKRQTIEPRAVLRGDANPPAIVARFDVDGRPFTFYGVHMARPFVFNRQRRDVDHLIAALSSIQGPLLVAGSFNATPWSWAMTRLTLATGMVRGRALGATWPAAPPPMIPQFLIDHVMVRGGIGIVEVESGAAVGSDHLPTVAEIALR